MIDKDLDDDLDRKLHERFLEVYKEHLAKASTWPPMDLYELFYRAGRVDLAAENLAQLKAPSEAGHR